MGKFKFRLQKLLDIRIEKEEESKRGFKEAQIEKEKVEKKLSTLKESYNKYKYSPYGESLTQQKIRNIYLNALNTSIVETNKELKDKIRKLDEKREELRKRQIERKTVETLKDKQLQIFIKEENLMEQKAIDEFALYGFLRNQERR